MSWRPTCARSSNSTTRLWVCSSQRMAETISPHSLGSYQLSGAPTTHPHLRLVLQAWANHEIDKGSARSPKISTTATASRRTVRAQALRSSSAKRTNSLQNRLAAGQGQCLLDAKEASKPRTMIMVRVRRVAPPSLDLSPVLQRRAPLIERAEQTVIFRRYDTATIPMSAFSKFLIDTLLALSLAR